MILHTDTKTRRGGFLTAMATFLALAVSVDLLKAFTKPPPPGQKPFGMQMPPAGLVVLGVHHTGWDETVLGVLLAMFLSFYAVGVWRMKRYAVTLGWIYAAYVILNVTLFKMRNPAAAYPGREALRNRVLHCRDGSYSRHRDGANAPQRGARMTISCGFVKPDDSSSRTYRIRIADPQIVSRHSIEFGAF